MDTSELLRTPLNVFLLSLIFGADVPRSLSHQEKVVANSGSDCLLNRGSPQRPAACVHALCEGQTQRNSYRGQKWPL
jgi:hypothetical protein